jgi:predicted Zn-dependent protease
MKKRTAKIIKDLYQRERWAKARALIVRELKKVPDDHWYLTRLSGTHYEEHNYKKAREASDKAVKLMPLCPLVLWDRAGILEMLGQQAQAIAIWKRLLKRGTKSVAYGPCGEGLTWAKSLLNDCRYRIANTYRQLGKSNQARLYYKAYLKQRAQGVPSVYDKRTVRKQFVGLS